MTNCLHCKKKLPEDSVLDVCDNCGYKVWGERMLKAIKESMAKARDIGDLYQGSVTDFDSNKF